jgi:hypothetical protein
MCPTAFKCLSERALEGFVELERDLARGVYFVDNDMELFEDG